MTDPAHPHRAAEDDPPDDLLLLQQIAAAAIALRDRQRAVARARGANATAMAFEEEEQAARTLDNLLAGISTTAASAPDDRPSIAELRRAIAKASGIDSLADGLRAQHVLLEIAAAALALDAAFARDYSTSTALARVALARKLKLALSKVRP